MPAGHSETAHTTNRALDFMREAGARPWLAHLSFIKPHWPCVVPAPDAGMYSPEDALRVVRSDAERTDPHPVVGAMTRHRMTRTFAKPGIRDAVMVGNMGLVKQIDDELGRPRSLSSIQHVAGEVPHVFPTRTTTAPGGRRQVVDLQGNPEPGMVGSAGFEPATPAV